MNWLPGPRGPAREVVERLEGLSGELVLMKVGESEYEIVAGGSFLMTTHDTASERALARLALEAVGEPAGAGGGIAGNAGIGAVTTAGDAATAAGAGGLRVLVGGLGVGATLAAVLESPLVSSVVVVELEPAIVRWNREHFAAGGRALADPRVKPVLGDLGAFLAHAARTAGARRPRAGPVALPETAGAFDVILCDTDNGPGWIVHAPNRALYGPRGLRRISRALRPGGVVAFWSGAPAAGFEGALKRAGFEKVSLVEVPDAAGRLEPDLIYIARRSA